MKDLELIEIYNNSNTFISVSKKILKNLYTYNEDIIFTDEDKCIYLLKIYRRIINLVEPVSRWPGDPDEAAIFAKYWAIRNSLPHTDNNIVIKGNAIDLLQL